MEFPKRLHYIKPPPDETWDFLENLDWLSNIGNESDLSHEKALELAASEAWEDFTLERRNDITGHLAQQHRNRETEWNKVAIGYRNYCENKIFPSLRVAAEQHELNEKVFQSISWNIISYMMEETYVSWGIPRFFYKVVESFKKGKLPCGWEGNYPEGFLIEY